MPERGCRAARNIDTTTAAVAAKVSVGRQPLAVALTSDGLSAYVSNSSSATVSIIQGPSAMSPDKGPMNDGTMVTITGTI
jgi:DNA-binding beta-propeller fold protein YncE